MTPCREFQKWWRENFVTPVMGAMTTWVQACREYRQGVRREVSRPMEQFVSMAQQVCNSWPWPLNWLCSVVVTVVRVVVWIVEVIVEWVVSIVCELIAVSIQILLRTISIIVEFVVAFFVCLVTDFEGWLNAFHELHTGILDLGETLVDTVGTLLDATLGILEGLGLLLENVVIALVSAIPFFGELLGRALAGLIHYVFGAVRRGLEIVRDVIDHVQDIAFGLGRLDMCRAATGAMGLGTDILQVILLGTNVLVGWIGGVRDSYVAGSMSGSPPDRDNLTSIIDARLVRAFGDDIGGLRRARARVRLYSRPIGLPILILPWRLYLDSRSTTVDLRKLHNDGLLNLYSAIGGPNVCEGRTVNDFQHWEVVYGRSGVRVTRRDIDLFLSDGPMSVAPFRVYAITHAVFERHLDVARRKGHEIGLGFTWGRIREYAISNADEFHFVRSSQGDILTRFGRTGGGPDDLCQVPALAIHAYRKAPKANGLTSWFRPPADTGPSGVSFRDRSPEFIFRWVLIHELGHYFGLSHPGHDGLENIMFTNDEDEGLTAVTGGTVAEYIVFSGEPHFTLDDARTVWDWLTTTAIACVRGD
jgi:hypothetical protein